MNKYLADLFGTYSQRVQECKQFVANLQKKHPHVPDLYFSKRYWKSLDRLREIEPHLDSDFTVPNRAADSAGMFTCSPSAFMVVDAYKKLSVELGTELNVNVLSRTWKFVEQLRTDGFHELHIDRERAKILAQTKCNFDVNDFKSPYKSMIVVYPEDLAQDFMGEHVKSCPIFSYCHHDADEGLLEINHFYFELNPKNLKGFCDNYFAFGCKTHDYHYNVEESLSRNKQLCDPDGYNSHAYYYCRIAINALMVSTMKDWSTPLGKKYEDDSRKNRQKVKSLLPNFGAGLSFTADKVTMKLPTLTMPSGTLSLIHI